MSWIRESSLNILERLVIKIVRCGEIPNHIALIMDGNRRFASKTNSEKSVGHSKGFDKLAETLKWCLDLGVREVTVYAFSIENLKRSKEEVDYLMNLAREKFVKLLEEEEKLREEGVNIRVIGNLSLLPNDLVKLIARAVAITKDNNRARLNIAFAYTSRDEMARVAYDLSRGVSEREIEPSEISTSVIDGALYSQDSPPPDLLIRTSGELRLSDFLLWQSSHTFIYFSKVLWPEFSIWDLLGAVVAYQRARPNLPTLSKPKPTPRASEYLKNLYASRFHDLTSLECCEKSNAS